MTTAMTKVANGAGKVLGTAITLLVITMMMGAFLSSPAKAAPGDGDLNEGGEGNTGASVSNDKGITASGICGSLATADKNGETATSTDWLPVNRWSDATSSFHSRLDADAWNDVAEKVQRNGVSSTAMAGGNAMWSMSSSVLYASGSFCPMQRLSTHMDEVVGKLGKALNTSGVIALFIITGLISVFVRYHKHEIPLGQLLFEIVKTGVITGVIIVMINGASASSVSRGYIGAGSPAWWVATTNDAVNKVTGKVANAWENNGVIEIGYEPVYGGDPLPEYDVYNCKKYVKWLKATYKRKWSSTSGYELANMVSGMWEASALPAWASQQFGTDNPYTDHMYCFALESKRMAAVQNSDVRDYGISQESSWGKGKSSEKWYSNARTSSMFTGETVKEDKALVGWAACKPVSFEKAEVRDEWNKDSKKKVPNKICTEWWAHDGGEMASLEELNWQDSVEETFSNSGDNAGQANFISSLHGKGGSSSIISNVSFAVGSGIDAVVFMALAAIQAVGKLVLCFMIVGLFMSMFKMLLPGSSSETFKKAAKRILGAAFAASGVSVIIGFVCIIAQVIIELAREMFSPGSVGIMIFSAFAPAIGVIGVHFIFKLMKLPSPFTVKGAMAWGQGISSGAIGGALAGGAASALAGARSLARRGKGKGDGESAGDRTTGADGDDETSTDGRRGGENARRSKRSGTEAMEEKAARAGDKADDAKARLAAAREEAARKRQVRKDAKSQGADSKDAGRRNRIQRQYRKDNGASTLGDRLRDAAAGAGAAAASKARNTKAQFRSLADPGAAKRRVNAAKAKAVGVKEAAANAAKAFKEAPLEATAYAGRRTAQAARNGALAVSRAKNAVATNKREIATNAALATGGMLLAGPAGAVGAVAGRKAAHKAVDSARERWKDRSDRLNSAFASSVDDTPTVAPTRPAPVPTAASAPMPSNPAPQVSPMTPEAPVAATAPENFSGYTGGSDAYSQRVLDQVRGQYGDQAVTRPVPPAAPTGSTPQF
jgi:hypothetical protein